MDPIAVISDIHGNLAALTAVLEDIDRRGVVQIVCLGDVVGYGPEPAACLDLVLGRCRVAPRRRTPGRGRAREAPPAASSTAW